MTKSGETSDRRWSGERTPASKWQRGLPLHAPGEEEERYFSRFLTKARPQPVHDVLDTLLRVEYTLQNHLVHKVNANDCLFVHHRFLQLLQRHP